MKITPYTYSGMANQTHLKSQSRTQTSPSYSPKSNVSFKGGGAGNVFFIKQLLIALALMNLLPGYKVVDNKLVKVPETPSNSIVETVDNTNDDRYIEDNVPIYPPIPEPTMPFQKPNPIKADSVEDFMGFGKKAEEYVAENLVGQNGKTIREEADKFISQAEEKEAKSKETQERFEKEWDLFTKGQSTYSYEQLKDMAQEAENHSFDARQLRGLGNSLGEIAGYIDDARYCICTGIIPNENLVKKSDSDEVADGKRQSTRKIVADEVERLNNEAANLKLNGDNEKAEKYLSTARGLQIMLDNGDDYVYGPIAPEEPVPPEPTIPTFIPIPVQPIPTEPTPPIQKPYPINADSVEDFMGFDKKAEEYVAENLVGKDGKTIRKEADKLISQAEEKEAKSKETQERFEKEWDLFTKGQSTYSYEQLKDMAQEAENHSFDARQLRGLGNSLGQIAGYIDDARYCICTGIIPNENLIKKSDSDEVADKKGQSTRQIIADEVERLNNEAENLKLNGDKEKAEQYISTARGLQIMLDNGDDYVYGPIAPEEPVPPEPTIPTPIPTPIPTIEPQPIPTEPTPSEPTIPAIDAQSVPIEPIPTEPIILTIEAQPIPTIDLEPTLITGFEGMEDKAENELLTTPLPKDDEQIDGYKNAEE